MNTGCPNVEPLVCTVILNWNGWPVTLECLSSLSTLDYPNYSLVVVDNGSTDESVVRIRESFPDLTLLETDKNLGFAGGNNVGIVFALENGADYVWLLNNDTVVESRSLSAMVAVAKKDRRVGAVGSVLFHMDNPHRVHCWGGGGLRPWLGVPRRYTVAVPQKRLSYLVGASILIRRETLEDVGLWDDRFFMDWEDIEFGFRLRKAGWRLSVASEAHIWHKISTSTHSMRLQRLIYNRTSAVRFLRHHASFSALPILLGTCWELMKLMKSGGRKLGFFGNRHR